MSSDTVNIPGESVLERAATAAGVLAELSAKTVEYNAGSVRRELVARRTDLPGVIERGVTDHGRASVVGAGVEFEFSVGGAVARGDPETIVKVRSIISR